MPPLSPDAKRIRTIIVAFPVLVVTTAILYRRAYLGEQPRTIPPASAVDAAGDRRLLGPGASEIGAAPWVVQGGGGEAGAGAGAGAVLPGARR